MAEGIEVRKHSKGTSYRASVWDAARERRVRKTAYLERQLAI